MQILTFTQRGTDLRVGIRKDTVEAIMEMGDGSCTIVTGTDTYRVNGKYEVIAEWFKLKEKHK